jgi:hypothetical protein
MVCIARAHIRPHERHADDVGRDVSSTTATYAAAADAISKNAKSEIEMCRYGRRRLIRLCRQTRESVLTVRPTTNARTIERHKIK